MDDGDWENDEAGSFALFVNGDAIPDPGRRGERVSDDSFVVIVNAHADPATWQLRSEWGSNFTVMIHTGPPELPAKVGAGETFELPGRTAAVWRCEP